MAASQRRMPSFQRHSPESREAALSVYYEAPSQRARVVDVLRRFGALTDHNISRLAGLDPNSARPRRIELVANGTVERDPLDGFSPRGRRAARWRLASHPQEGSPPFSDPSE